jgi:hypothetical protein
MAFKMKGFPVHGTAAVKHTRRREGHMAKYGAGHTNADHPDYWTKDEKTGKTPKSVEVEADTKSKSSETKSTKNETKNKKNEKKSKKKVTLKGLLTRFDDAIQSRMKNPRSDWDAEGYEERKKEYNK